MLSPAPLYVVIDRDEEGWAVDVSVTPRPEGREVLFRSYDQEECAAVAERQAIVQAHPDKFFALFPPYPSEGWGGATWKAPALVVVMPEIPESAS
jgi:hypothetical protein